MVMSNASDREKIRQEKLERMQQDNVGNSTDSSDASGSAPAEPIHVNGGEELQSVADQYDVVLVDCYADWCGPCKMIEPIVEQIAADTSAAVAKVDIDVNQQLAAQLGVRGVPTLFLYADGKQVEQLVGVQDETRLRELIERHS